MHQMDTDMSDNDNQNQARFISGLSNQTIDSPLRAPLIVMVLKVMEGL